MLPTLCLAAATLAVGTTTLPELCRWLTERTGAPHAVAGELRDYPVFLSLHQTEAARVERLVATALGGRWEQDGATRRLMPVRPKEGEGLAEFTRAFRAAVPASNPISKLPPEDLFRMRAGEMARYGEPEGRFVRPLPKSLAARAGVADAEPSIVYVRKFASGMFQTKVQLPNASKGPFDASSDVQFASLPPEVEAALGEEGKAIALDPQALATVKRLTQDPTAHRVDWSAVDRIDPLAGMVDPVLRPTAERMKEDLVVALPDFAIVALPAGEGGNTVAAVLRRLGITDEWSVVEGAFVGRLPASERLNRSQTHRGVLASFVRSVGVGGVPTTAAIADYLAQQSPAASECWTDAVMLIAAGVVLDQTYVGDYPYNLRFCAKLSDGDWRILRSGGVFGLNALSPAAQTALLPLLVSPIERINGSDPATWPGFPSRPLSLNATTSDETVLIGYVGFAPLVEPPGAMGSGYARHKAQLGREPLYRVARRRRLRLSIAAEGQGPPVDTGFVELTPILGSKPVPYRQLPKEIVKEFESGSAREVGAAPVPASAAP